MMTVVKAPEVTRVLIAESDPWIREMLSEMVLSVRCDASVQVCADGGQALQWLKGDVPDLVIASRELAGIDGLSLLRKVRLARKQPIIPFILLCNWRPLPI
jgi:CheY-like chemotaxis protein